MQYSPKNTGFWNQDEPFWSRYAFALGVSALAWVAQIYLSRWFDGALTPFLPGFAAVIASAGWAGFGPGVFSTAIVTAWCEVFLYGEHRFSTAGIVMRAAIFVVEGLLLSIGSARLRRATRDAARSEDWHRKIVDTASEGIWVVDELCTVTYANPRLAEIIGLRPGELAGRKMDEFFFPDDHPIERIRFDNRRAGMKEQFDRRLQKPDGTEVWVLTCSNTFRDPKSGSMGVLSMMTDITERKKAENALQLSEARFRGLFENVLEGVYQSTPAGRIVAANPMLLRMLGLTSEAELNDVNIARDLYVDAGVRSQLLDKLEHDGSFQNVEYELRRRDGQIITVQENARVVRDKEGKVLYYEGTLTDNTERTRIEEQLRQAQKAEALGRLAGGIAHDFSNILTVLSGYAHLVLAELSPSHPAHANAEHLVAAAESAAGLTAQLLSFSHRDMEPAALAELNWIIREAEEYIHSFLNAQRAAKVDLILSLHPRALPVQADAGHIRQILMSLTAAVRDTIGEGGAVRIGTAPAEDAAAEPLDYAVISVQAAEPAEFHPEGGSSELSEGLGISTTEAILAQYGGFLKVERLAAGGLCFSVYLPARQLV